MSSTERASQYIAASPHTSGSEASRDTMTGHPQDIASSGGNPKPSYSEGNRKQAAFSYSALNSPSDTKPAGMTFF